MAAAGTSPNPPWHRGHRGDERPGALSDGGVGRCGAEDVSSSIETAIDKERPEQGYGWKPYDEEKAERRPVAAHYRTVHILTASLESIASAEPPLR